MRSEGVRVVARAHSLARPNAPPALYSGTIASRLDLQSWQYLVSILSVVFYFYASDLYLSRLGELKLVVMGFGKIRP